MSQTVDGMYGVSHIQSSRTRSMFISFGYCPVSGRSRGRGRGRGRARTVPAPC